MEQNLSLINNLLPVLTSGNTAVWVCETSSGLLDFKNNYFDILGLTHLGVKFSTLDELRAVIHSDDLPDFEQAFADASVGKSGSVVYRCCSKDQQIQMESKLIPCGNGVVACTRNKDTALLLQQKEKQYKTVVNSMFPNFIWVFSDSFHIVDVILPDGVKLFHSREELIGRDARVQYAPEVNELFIANIRECLKNNQWREIEYYIDLFGTRYFYQSRIVPMDEHTVFCLNMEIGDRVRRMEELLTQRQRAEESDRMKNVFISTMSHEIRTPLNAIIGFSEFLMKEKSLQKRQKYMDIVRASNVQLKQIVNNILDLSHMEAGMTEFQFEDTEISALMMEVVEDNLSDKKPDVRFWIEIPDGDLHALTNAFRVKQVLSNLISNAVKYTEKGSIILKVEKGNEYLTFSVSDTGRGIPEDKLDIIFDRFEKLDRFVKGTGLGLSICKSIVERLGGNITVTSKIGEGSVFSFHIPYRDIAYSTKNTDSNTVSQRKKILVSEKTEDGLKFVRETLSKKYDIVEVIDDEKIINSIILDHPILALVDMEIAGKKEIIGRMHAISPKMPIIAMTSSDYYHDQRRAFENGCTDFIAKPFSASKLEEVVMAFIA